MGMYPSDQRVAFVSPRVIGVGHVDSGVTAVILSLFFSPSFKLAAQSQEISGLEDTVASLRDDYERSLSANSASQKGLQENLISAKHELLRVQEQLSLAEKVCVTVCVFFVLTSRPTLTSICKLTRVRGFLKHVFQSRPSYGNGSVSVRSASVAVIFMCVCVCVACRSWTRSSSKLRPTAT